MANVTQFRSQARAEEEASVWLARLDRGLSAGERAEIEEWLRVAPQHRQALFELASFWDELDVLVELSALFPFEQSQRPRVAVSRVRRVWAVAVAGVACLAIGAWFFVARVVPSASRAEPVVVQEQAEDFETAVGGNASERLTDGSVVNLNTDTALTAVYSTVARDVFLRRGEAHFDVAHDADHPFRVHAGNYVVEAVGTAFNVQLRPDGELEVAVTEGKVKVSRVRAAVASPASSVGRAGGSEPLDAVLVEGQVALLDEAALLQGAVAPQVQRLDLADLDNKLAWRTGMLIFQGEPLRQVVADVGRYTTAEFVIADAGIASVRVGGYFRVGDIDGLLVALRENFSIDSEFTADNKIVLRLAK